MESTANKTTLLNDNGIWTRLDESFLVYRAIVVLDGHRKEGLMKSPTYATVATGEEERI